MRVLLSCAYAPGASRAWSRTRTYLFRIVLDTRKERRAVVAFSVFSEWALQFVALSCGP